MVLQATYIFLATAVFQAVIVSGDSCTNHDLGIFGGHKVTVQDAPFIIALYHDFGNNSEYSPFCGGSIIHERFVLTAAHCPYFVNAVYGFPEKRVRIGTDHLDAGGVFIDVESEFCMESFGDIGLQNDICLLKLKEPVTFGSKVAKVELPGEDFVLKVGTLVNVTGFGDLGNNQGMANELRQISVPIMSDECCNQLYEELGDTQLCAGLRGHDSCKGDSGGPLTYNGIQVGVVSYGETCSNSTGGVYTKVSSYVKWIKTTIEENM